MACCGFYYEELVAVAKLSYPTAIINSTDTLVNLLCIVMLGFYRTDDLAVGAVGVAYFSIVWFFMEGFLTAQDSLAYQSFTLKQKNGVKYWSFIAITTMLPLCSVGSVLFFLAPYIIPHYMAVEATLADKSSYFVIASIPSLWVLAAVRVVQKYLQAQNIMAPSMVCGVIGVVTVFVANLIFIYAADGGYIGCAFAVGAWDIVKGTPPSHPMFREQIRKADLDRDEDAEDAPLMELTDMQDSRERSSKRSKKKKHIDVDSGKGKLSFEKWKHGVFQGIQRFVFLGLPGAIILGLELWSFDIGTILASYIGPVTLSAHKILMLWTIFLYISIPFSLSITASIRVASLLAAQNPRGAALTARIVLLLGLILSVIYYLLTYHLGDYIGYIFSSDTDTRHRVALLAPAVAVFQLANALQPCAQGILRGCGQQGTVVLLNFLSMWVFGFPAGLALAFYVRPSYGINGLWYGYTLGIGMQTVVLVFMILTTNWETEVRKARLRIEHLTQDIPDSDGGSLDALSEMQIAMPRPGSRAPGGFLLTSELGDEYLDDLERIEITELYDPMQRPSETTMVV